MDNRIYLTFLMSCFFTLNLLGQCIPNYPVPPSPTCGDVSYCLCLSELNGYCSALSSPPSNEPYPLCPDGGVPDNLDWFQFRASVPDITIEITPSNCQSGLLMGLQAGVYYDYTFTEVLACVSECQINPFQLVMTNLEVGHCYSLFIDGCAGNICEYEIEVIQPDPTTISSDPLGPIGPITPESLSICEGGTALFSIPLVDNAACYHWTVPPGATYIVANDAGNEILVTFGDTGGQVCVSAIKFCEYEEVTICAEVTIIPPPEGYETGTYCAGSEACYPCPADGQCYMEGYYIITIENGSYLGCDSIIHLIVTATPSSESFVEAVICAGESYEICGTQINTPGIYSIDCSPNFNGCDSTINLTCILLDPYAVIQPPPVLGCGSGVSIFLDGSNSLGDSFWWETNNGEICDDPTNLILEICAPGTYCLNAISSHTYSDGSIDECYAQTCVDVLPNEEVSDIMITGTDGLCAGDDTGTATAIITSGTPPYSYQWCNGTTTSNNQNLPAGECCVTVTDATGCSTTGCHVVNTPATLSCYSEVLDLLCNGDNSGTATIFGVGGTAPYSFLWCNGQTGSTVTGLPSGDCLVIVEDANGCTTSVPVTINEPPVVNITTMSTDISCAGANDGTAGVMSTGGLGGYTFEWSNNEIGPGISNLPAGDFNVTLTDANGCTTTETVSINQPNPITLITSSTNINCIDPNSGEATVIASGGTAPYSYEWSNGETTDSPNNLAVGPTEVTVTDINGCSEIISIVIGEPDEIEILASTQDALCGAENGTISLIVNGGTAPYSYLWNNGMTTEFLNDLGSGSYIVTVTDNLGCTQSYQQVVENTSEVLLTINPTPTSCNNIADGSILLNIIGGQAPFSYEWSSGESSQNISNLLAGEYYVTVTDNNNCSTTVSAIIEEPNPLTALSLLPVNISCNSGNDGSIALTVSGGTLPYSYDWDNAPDIANPSNLSPGNYTATVTDFNGCSTVSSTTLTAPPALDLMINSTPTSCADQEDGAINLMVTGGSPPFQYDWSNGATTEDLNAISSGTYTIIVTDANDCSSIQTETILSPEALNISIETLSEYETGNVSCPDATDGFATVLASGGIAPFNYIWSNSIEGPEVSNLSAGNYQVTTTDANGCTEETVVTLEAPEDLTITRYTQDISCHSKNDGLLRINEVTGGSSPYLYALNGTAFSDTKIFNNLSPGLYEVIVQDARGCSNSFTESIQEPSELVIDIEIGSDKEELTLGEQIMLHAQINRDTVFLQEWGWTEGNYWMDPDCPQCSEREIKPLKSTRYAYEIKDVSGCTQRSEAWVKVNKKQSVYVPNVFSPNGDAVNDYFQIYFGKNVHKIKSLLVYNRWGEIVYTINDYDAMEPNEGWDGKLNGVPLNPGLFVYWAEVEYIDGRVEILKGDLTLLR